MSYISKEGISNGNVIEADYLLRIIKALNGESTDDIKIAGNLQLAGKIFIGATELLASALELNGLNNRTPGTTEAEKPLIPDADKTLDYLRITSLSVQQLVLDQPDVGGIVGKIYAYNNFV